MFIVVTENDSAKFNILLQLSVEQELKRWIFLHFHWTDVRLILF